MAYFNLKTTFKTIILTYHDEVSWVVFFAHMNDQIAEFGIVSEVFW